MRALYLMAGVAFAAAVPAGCGGPDNSPVPPVQEVTPPPPPPVTPPPPPPVTAPLDSVTDSLRATHR